MMIIDFNILTRVGFSKQRVRGRRSLEEIYEIVKSKLPGLCNDKCHEAKGYKNAPKWKHVVRNALEELKDQKIIKSKQFLLILMLFLMISSILYNLEIMKV